MTSLRFPLIVALALLALAPRAALAVERVPFTETNGLLVVQGSVDAQAPVPMLVDLGAGVDVLSGKVGRPTVTVTGKYATLRLTGQRVDLPLGTVVSLALGEIKLDPTNVGVWTGLDATGYGGLVSARAFRNIAITFDFPNHQLVAEDAVSYPDRKRTATRVGLVLEDDLGIAVDLFARFDFGNGVTALCELTGENGISIDSHFAPKLGVNLSDPSLKKISSRWGQEVAATIPSLTMEGAPQTKMVKPVVGFGDLIHDCSVGNGFWNGRTFTLDVPSRTLYVQLND